MAIINERLYVCLLCFIFFLTIYVALLKYVYWFNFDYALVLLMISLNLLNK